jgi:cephalosporin-C deacetylase-like acetyl esterase
MDDKPLGGPAMNPRLIPTLIRLWYSLLFVLLAVVAGRAQDPETKPGDEMIEKYLAQESDKLGQRVLDGATTRQEWEVRRPRLRQEYLDMLGLWPLPEKTPLNAKVTGTVERGDVTIEKLHFQSKPGLYVTGNLYRPKKTEGKLPAVLYVCGHSGRGRDGNKTAFQDHGMWFATNGYVCLIIDTLQLGEVPGIHHGTYGIRGTNPVEVRWWWQAVGYTPAGVECWNGIRALDYLVSRPDVDAERLAVTGISGGGAATFWIAAADERVRCAVPVSGMSDLESYVKNKVINGHCDCMFLVNTYGWEWTTIAALVAPRPLLFANSDKDPIFPMDGNRRIIARLRQLYRLYDKSDLVDEYVSAGGHDYRPDLRVAVFAWINKHIKNDTNSVKDADFTPLPGKQLRVFAEDTDLPADAINSKIDESFVPRPTVKLPQEGKFEDWKKELLKELREMSFRSFPERIPIPESIFRAVSGGAEHENFTTESGVGIRTLARSFENNWKKHKEPWTLLVSELEGKPVDFPTWARPFTEDFPTVQITLRGVDVFEWSHKSPPNFVERSLALLGRTADQGRVWDVAAYARRLSENSEKPVRVVGEGQAGILGAYAALFEPSITEVVIVDPPVSHRDGPIFLNVLRVCDIPDALGMLAPRPLTLVNAKDMAFDRTAQIYKLAGAEDKLQRK